MKRLVVRRVLISTPFLHLNNLPWVRAFESIGVTTSFVTLSSSLQYSDEISTHLLRNVTGARKKMLYLPNLFTIIRILKKERPDLLILREFSITNIMLSLLSRLMLRSSTIFYDQNEIEYSGKMRILSRLLISPHLMTTAPGESHFLHKSSTAPGSWFRTATFVPFFFPPQVSHDYIRRKYLDSTGPLRIVCVGKYRMRRKNMRLLVKSLEALLLEQSVSLSLVGKIESNHDPQYSSLLTLCDGLTNRGARISVLTNLSQNAVFEEFKKAHIFILPSENEPASISQIEAMAHGLPVIVCTDNGTRYVVSEGENGLLIEPTEESIRHAVKIILQDRNNLGWWASNALTTVENTFSQAAFIGSFQAFLAGENRCFDMQPSP